MRAVTERTVWWTLTVSQLFPLPLSLGNLICITLPMSLTSKNITHEKLLQIVQTRPDDYLPWGLYDRDASEESYL